MQFSLLRPPPLQREVMFQKGGRNDARVRYMKKWNIPHQSYLYHRDEKWLRMISVQVQKISLYRCRVVIRVHKINSLMLGVTQSSYTEEQPSTSCEGSFRRAPASSSCTSENALWIVAWIPDTSCTSTAASWISDVLVEWSTSVLLVTSWNLSSTALSWHC